MISDKYCTLGILCMVLTIQPMFTVAGNTFYMSQKINASLNQSDPVHVIHTRTDVSLQACVSACQDWAACHFMNFRPEFRLCYLITVSPGVVPVVTSAPWYLYGIKPERATNSACSECQENEICVDNTCQAQGCGPFAAGPGVTVHGNVFTIGSSLFVMGPGYRRYITCTQESTWHSESSFTTFTTTPGVETTTPFYPSCPPAWSNINGKCFKHVNTQLSWYHAENQCQILAGHLAHVYEISDLTAYAGILGCSLGSLGCEPWLGINDINSEGLLLGVTGQSVAQSVANTVTGTDNTSDQDCSYLSIGRDLLFFSCTTPDSFICEKDPQ